MKRAQFRGFTLIEMLVALMVAAILTTVSLNVYAQFRHNIAETSDRYVRFATENANELRCRTRFVRGISQNTHASPNLLPCDSAGFGAARNDLRQRF
jgi:prepilin-type N-terminal cleavage/methylation domain-containing protein